MSIELDPPPPGVIEIPSDGEPFFSTDNYDQGAVDGTFSNLVGAPLTHENIVANMRAAMRSLRPFTRDSLEFTLRRALVETGQDNAAHIVFGEIDPGRSRAHILAAVPPRVVRLLEEGIRNDVPVHLDVSVSALGYCEEHEDCRGHEGLAAACWASTH